MTARRVLLRIHLYLGLAAALFLIVLGLTGSVMAFENDIDQWMHPGLWSVVAQPRALPEAQLIDAVERRFAPARVAAVQISRSRNLARLMQMTDGAAVFVNPYSGAIQSRMKGPSRTQKILGYIHQIHLRLAPDPRSTPALAAAGKVAISWAGAILCLLVPTGAILFIRTRRAGIKWNASWFRICFDTHHVVGIYAGLFLFIAAFTGILIGFEWGEKAIYTATSSERPGRPPRTRSTPLPDGARIEVDQAIGVARNAIPGAAVAGIFLPLKSDDAYTVLVRVPEETSEAVHSIVSVDRYSGKVLDVRNFLTDSQGYRVIRFNRSIHTGDIWGLPGHVLVSVSSLALVVMSVTGLVIWWKKLAI